MGSAGLGGDGGGEGRGGGRGGVNGGFFFEFFLVSFSLDAFLPEFPLLVPDFPVSVVLFVDFSVDVDFPVPLSPFQRLCSFSPSTALSPLL